MLTADEIKKVSALAARHADERTALACRQQNEREELIERHNAEKEKLGIGKPAGAPGPATSTRKGSPLARR